MKTLNLKTLKALAKSLGLRGFSRLTKSQLIDFIKVNFITRPKKIPAPRKPISPPRKPVPPQQQSVRFRPDRPRQPELMRRLEAIPSPRRPPIPPPRPAGPRQQKPSHPI